MRIQKFTIDTESQTALTIVGFSSYLKDYQFGYFLNKKLNISLIKMDDIKIYVQRSKSVEEFRFYFHHSDYQISYYLIANKEGSKIIFPSFKQLDYFLIISTKINDLDFENMIVRLRAIKGVSMAIDLRSRQLNGLEYVLDDIEIHMTEIMEKENPLRNSLLMNQYV